MSNLEYHNYLENPWWDAVITQWVTDEALPGSPRMVERSYVATIA